jgi:hypothetical protein
LNNALKRIPVTRDYHLVTRPATIRLCFIRYASLSPSTEFTSVHCVRAVRYYLAIDSVAAENYKRFSY